MQKYRKFLVVFDWSRFVILTIWLVEKYCFVLEQNVHKKLMWNLEWLNEFFLTAKNRLQGIDSSCFQNW